MTMSRRMITNAIIGLIALITILRYGITLNTLLIFALTVILISIAIIDFQTMTIPDGLIIAVLLIAAISVWIMPYTSLFDRILGFVIVSVPMFILTLIIPGCFGGGDIKLMAAAGLFLGWKLTVLSLFIAICMGGAYATYLLTTKKIKKGTSAHMAFGPYLSAGIWLSLMTGSYIIEWYTGLFR